MSRRDRAFTLIELLVVVAIISMLIAMLLPSLSRARQHAQSVVCLSNLRQMGIAAQAYVCVNSDFYPVGQHRVISATGMTTFAWDFASERNWSTGEMKVWPGLLWAAQTAMEIQQCPSFQGPANSLNDPYTGYNYNVSYIGHGQGEATDPPARLLVPPARSGQVRRPAACALFGDGQYGAGANKFMRSPWDHSLDRFPARAAGTQGFRHLSRTNVGFCDGHAEPLRIRYTQTLVSEVPKIAPDTGFLSPDNSLYDLK
ncbi:MAG: type II secretion system protein [Phycisphaerae bacterium]|nr:type II secretion system protein [Phycisphaerae bacterium]